MAGGCAAGTTSPERLRFAVVRSGSSSFDRDGYVPVAGFLSARLGIPVDLVAVDRYADLAVVLEAGGAEFALMPPLAYVEARERIPCLRPLVTMAAEGEVWYSGYILVPRDSDVTSIEQLAGRRVAFVERHSASGYLFPAMRLRAAGIDPERGIEPVFLGDHMDVLRAVAERRVDAGASFGSAIKAARKLGVDVSSLRVMAITGRIPLDAVVARPDLDEGIVARVERAFRELNVLTPAGRAALGLLEGVDAFVPTTDEFYEPVRAALRTEASRGTDAPARTADAGKVVGRQ